MIYIVCSCDIWKMRNSMRIITATTSVYKMCREEDSVLCPACYKKEHPCLDAQRSPIALLFKKKYRCQTKQ